MITRIGHLAFRVTDLDRALAFYCGILGCKEAFRLDRDGEPSPWIVYLQVSPGNFIELFPDPAGHLSADVTPRSIGYNHFCLVVDDMDATISLLATRGHSVNGAARQGIDTNWQYWVSDPDGNRIELMQIMPSSPHAHADATWTGQ